MGAGPATFPARPGCSSNLRLPLGCSMPLVPRFLVAACGASLVLVYLLTSLCAALCVYLLWSSLAASDLAARRARRQPLASTFHLHTNLLPERLDQLRSTAFLGGGRQHVRCAAAAPG